MNVFEEIIMKSEEQKKTLLHAHQLKENFASRADNNDRTGKFPSENFDELKEAGFLSLTVPKQYGGKEVSLSEFLLIQETLAQGDGATALCLGWHLGIVMNLNQLQKWDADVYGSLCEKIVESQVLINSAQSEVKTGSPTRGGKPFTTAKKKGDKWVITGRKNYTTAAPALDCFIISATIQETGEVANFLIPRTINGVSIEETWDTLGMRATRSDDLVLDHVEVEEGALVERIEKKGKPRPQGWLLHIPACYLGIATAARNEAVAFAENFQPNSLPGPIKDVPEIRRKIGEIEIKLMQARHLMYSVANQWDNHTELREKLGPELSSVKYTVTNAAVEVVDLAMRIMGGQSLFSSNPLQRYYRDVRAGIHNPPADDITLQSLANRTFGDK